MLPQNSAHFCVVSGWFRVEWYEYRPDCFRSKAPPVLQRRLFVFGLLNDRF
jgi:hypothetical protein